jgi:hypothetical protein
MALKNVSFYGQGPLNAIQAESARDPRNQMFQALMQKGVGNVQSPMEGLTKALTQGVGGYFAGKEAGEMDDRKAKYGEDMATVLSAMNAKPWINPDTGTAEVPKYVPQMASALGSMNLGIDDGSGGSEAPQVDMVPTAPAGGYEGAMYALSKINNPDLAGMGQQLAMQKYQQEYDARQAELARQNARDDYLYQQQNKSYPPKVPQPGRDVPYSPEVATQLTDIAAAKAAAANPSFETVPDMPGVQRNVGTGELKAAPMTPEQKTRAKIDEMQPKAEGALNSLTRQTKTVVTHINKALNLISPWSTGYGSVLANLPETDARALRNELDTIKANVGFDKLADMRANSPTGGALGNVSENENKLLQAVNGALDPGQSDQLRANLIAIKELYPQVLAERTAAYQKDYGGGAGESSTEDDPLGILPK